eukprot:1697115-Pleurochrysis_carterae.AAC.1
MAHKDTLSSLWLEQCDRCYASEIFRGFKKSHEDAKTAIFDSDSEVLQPKGAYLICAMHVFNN